MKKLIVVLLAFALPVAADGPVVCSETPQSPGVACSATTVSTSDCVCAATAEEAEAEPSVYDDAVALWKLDETSGTRADSIGSLDLTDNNTVGSTSKGVGAPANLPGTVASFVAANSEYLSQTSQAFMPHNDTDWTVSFWAYRNAGTGIIDYVSRYTDIQLFDNATTYQLYHEGSVATSPAITIPVNSWFHLIGTYTASDNKYRTYINNGAESISAATVTTNGGFDFFVGSRGDAFYIDGRMSTVAIWSRVLTSDERAALYNSGDGAVLP